jgi:uncharacterized repeat protein (TIGR02543 family)
MMPAETLDFSENNLKNASGFDYDPNRDGGNGDMSTAYLARWSGPVVEGDDPYDPSSTTSPSGLSPMRHVQNVMMLPQRSGPLDTADIKRALFDYGALVASMCWVGDGWEDTAYYKLNSAAYYYTGSFEVNHDVAVAGWDDAFPASNFSTPPPGNGAWIVKNSWGTAWGKSGYFFISYYDAVLFKKDPAYCFQAAEPTDNYTHVYQHDPLGHTGSCGYPGTLTAWEANVFTATATENVRAIGFYTLDVDCSYEVKVYGSWNGFTFSDLLSSTKGTIPSPGYHTIVLPSSGGPVASGQTFGVVVKKVTTSDRYPIALEQPVTEYSMGATAGSGQSYMSSDGTSWTDVTDDYPNANVCVKAYAGTLGTTATLTRQASPAGAGFVATSPPSADDTYSVGTVVTLTATPAAGYTFTGWSGDLTGTKNPTTVTMDANREVAASFTPNGERVVTLTIGSRTMLVDRDPVVLEAAPAIFNSRTLLPIRAVIEAFGGLAAWEASTCKVTITLGDSTLDLWIGKSQASLNGITLPIDSANPSVVPVITNGRTMLPLRFVAESLGIDVQYTDATKRITLTHALDITPAALPALPAAPVLISPAHDAVLPTLTPTLSWSAVPGATKYEVVICVAPHGRPYLVDEIVATTSYTVPAGVLSSGVRYGWTVFARNSAGWGPQLTIPGDTLSPGFTVQALPALPTAPVLISPEHDAILPTLTPTLSWKAVPGATKYEVVICVAPHGRPYVIDEVVATTSYTVPAGVLSSGVRYGWTVFAGNSAGWGPQLTIPGDTLSPGFTVQVGPTYPTGATAPAGVTATAGKSQVTISWDAVSGATSYNIYWSTTSGVTKTSGTRITGATSPYGHAGRTNGTRSLLLCCYGRESLRRERSVCPSVSNARRDIRSVLYYGM